MKSEWVLHKGKRLLFCNFADLSFEDMKSEVAAVEAVVLNQPENSVLELTNLQGVLMTPEIVDLLKKSTRSKKNYVLKEALIGTGFVKGRQALLEAALQISSQSLSVFASIEEAKDWLVAPNAG